MESLTVCADLVVVEEKEENSFSLKQMTKWDNDIADSHVRPDHDWERCVIRLVVNRDLEDRWEVRAMANFWMDLMFEIIVRRLWKSGGRREQSMWSIKDVIKVTIVRN